MMKISKIFAIVLAFTMLMSTVVFAGTVVEGTNNTTITLDLVKSAGYDAATPAESIASGSNFYVWFNFTGNPTVKADTVTGFDLFVEYDSSKVSFDAAMDVIASSVTFQPAFADGIMGAAWANLDGLAVKQGFSSVIQGSGTLFIVQGLAKTDLAKADLDAIKLVATVDGGKTQMTNATSGASFTIDVVEPEVVEPEYKDVDYTDDVAANTANVVADNVTYENVAVFKASFDLADLAEKNAKAYGISLNNNKKAFAFEGNGTVDYVLAFYGVTAEEADGISVDTYYTVSEEVK